MNAQDAFGYLAALGFGGGWLAVTSILNEMRKSGAAARAEAKRVEEILRLIHAEICRQGAQHEARLRAAKLDANLEGLLQRISKRQTPDSE